MMYAHAFLLLHHEVVSRKVLQGGYLFPKAGGCVYNGRRYTEHALERMAPETEEIFDILFSRALRRMEEAAAGMQIDFNQNWWEDFLPKARGILPTDVVREIQRPGSTDLTVKTDGTGAVITVFRREEEQEESDFSKRMFHAIRKQAQRIEKEFYGKEGSFSRVETASNHSSSIFPAQDKEYFETQHWVHEEKEKIGRRKYNDNVREKGFNPRTPIKLRKLRALIDRMIRKSRQRKFVLEQSFQNWGTQMKDGKRKKVTSIDILRWKEEHQKSIIITTVY